MQSTLSTRMRGAGLAALLATPLASGQSIASDSLRSELAQVRAQLAAQRELIDALGRELALQRQRQFH